MYKCNMYQIKQHFYFDVVMLSINFSYGQNMLLNNEKM